MDSYRKICYDFVVWCKPRLGIKGKIKVRLVNKDIQNRAQKTFGYYNPQTQQIIVSIKDRHPTDVLRTICHELVHRRQSEIRKLTAEDGATGSDIENEANALAGILLRLWNQV
jgi:Zn-dependent peptidase ImmA (M78 family)